MHTGGCVVPASTYLPQVASDGELTSVAVKDDPSALYAVVFYDDGGLPYRTELAEGRHAVLRAMKDALMIKVQAELYDLNAFEKPVADFLRHLHADAYGDDAIKVHHVIDPAHVEAAAILELFPEATVGEMVMEFSARQAEREPDERYSISEVSHRWLAGK